MKMNFKKAYNQAFTEREAVERIEKDQKNNENVLPNVKIAYDIRKVPHTDKFNIYFKIV